MSEKVYRTAIYARLSRDDGDKAESNSIMSQKALCEEFIANHSDMKLVETFVDDGYSGVDFNRPGFIRLENAIREKRVDALVCKDLSRFTRNYIEGGRYLQKIFPVLGVRFIAINDGYDTLSGNRSSDSFVIPFKNLINDTYAKDISVKVRTNLEVKRKKGEYVGSYTPYGYEKDPQNKNRLVVDEYAGNIVRQVFSLYKDGLSVSRISERLNELGVMSPMEYKRSKGIHFESPFKTGTEAKWSYLAVKRILTNEVYIGILSQGKRTTPNYKVHSIQKKDQSEWIRVEDAHEALISYDDFQAVQEMLGRDTRSTAPETEENVFSGFLYCADCGQPMVRKAIPRGGKKYYYYVCSTNKYHAGCSAHSISTREVEDSVIGAVQLQISNVLDISGTLDLIDSLPSKNRQALCFDAQIAKLEEDIERYHKMKLRTYEDLADGIISKQEYTDFQKQYSDMLDEKTAALERIKREKQGASVSGDSESSWVAMFRQYEGIHKISRRVLMSLVDKIIIHKKHGVEVLFKYGNKYRRAVEYIERNRELMASAK